MEHGIGMTGYRTASEMEKWQVCYRTKDGGFGIIGWIPLLDNKAEADRIGRKFMEENAYVSEIIVRHPPKLYSTY